MNKIFVNLGLITLLALLSFAALARVRNINEYNLQSGVGLKGYDPVAVFAEGGGAPREGRQQYQVSYEGVTYFLRAKRMLNCLRPILLSMNPLMVVTVPGRCFMLRKLM